MSIEVPAPKELRGNGLRHTLDRVRTSVRDRGPPDWWYKAGIILIMLVVVFATYPNYSYGQSDDERRGPGSSNQTEDNDAFSSITKYIPDTVVKASANNSIFSLVNGRIVDNYDLLNDPWNYSTISTPVRESSGWISDGAPSISFAEGVWYATHRQRTGGTFRGHYLLVDRSTDLANWESTWKVSTEDVSHASVVSFERAVVRHYEGSYYLYFCADIGGSWKVYYVKASTVEGLETELKNSTCWSVILSGSKDPNTFFHDGTYYFLNSDGLYKADNPEGTSIEFIVNFTQLYKDAYGGEFGNPGNNTGTILFDNGSGNFIYWRGAKVSWDNETVNDLIWFFATSPDLKRWTARDRSLVYLDYPVSSGSLRYMDCFVNDTTEVVIMEWEGDMGVGHRSCILWNYPIPTGKVGPKDPSGGGIGIADPSRAISFHYETTMSGIKFIPEIPRSMSIHHVEWDFGDGKGSDRLEPTHFYRVPGEYYITLSVTVDTAGPVEISRAVTVPRPTSMQQILHTFELADSGLNIWVGVDRPLLVPSATLFVLGVLLIVNAYLWGSVRRSAGRGFLVTIGTVLIVLAFLTGPGGA